MMEERVVASTEEEELDALLARLAGAEGGGEEAGWGELDGELDFEVELGEE
jgi:hypothetical protein